MRVNKWMQVCSFVVAITLADSHTSANGVGWLTYLALSGIWEVDLAKRVGSKNGKASSKKVRPTMASLVAMEISNDVEIHPYVVQRILDSLEKHAVLALKERGVFRMNFMTARLRTRQAQKETDKRVGGRDVTVKAKPARRTLRLTPTKYLRHQCL